MRSKKVKRFDELRALKGLIREKGTSYRKISEAIGITVNTFNDKINGFYPFSAPEIKDICNILDISGNDIVKYFFPDMLSNETKSA